MPQPPPVTLGKINIVARQFDDTLAFYRLLGLDISGDESSALRHVSVEHDGASFAIDNEALARFYSAEWRHATQPNSVLITAQLASREAVDETYERLVQAGHRPLQAPWDAFWGARYAIVADPEGNSVGLESPRQDDKHTWPPTASPDPVDNC